MKSRPVRDGFFVVLLQATSMVRPYSRAPALDIQREAQYNLFARLEILHIETAREA
jgi:hypothetical protein